MKNPERVHEILLGSHHLDVHSRLTREKIFFYLADEGDPESKIYCVIHGLARYDVNTAWHIERLGVDDVFQVLKALVVAFPQNRHMLAKSFCSALRNASTEKDKGEKRRFHCVILLGIFETDRMVSFDGLTKKSSHYDLPLIECLSACFHYRLLDRSLVSAKEASELSSQVKRFVEGAVSDLQDTDHPDRAYRWNALIELVKMAEKSVGNDYATGDSPDQPLECVLLRDICSKMFNTLPLFQKMNLLGRYLNVVEVKN